MEKVENIKRILKKEGLRITQGRVAVLETLVRAKAKLLSSEEIYQKISKSKKYSCDQVSVYRTLSMFEKLSLINKVSFNGEAARYELAEEQLKRKKKHQHFFKCIECNLIETLQHCSIIKKERELESKGYKELSHHLEIKGICPACTLS